MHKHVGTESHSHQHYYINAKMVCLQMKLDILFTKLTNMNFSIGHFSYCFYLHVSSVGRVPTSDPVVSRAGRFPGPLLSHAVVVEVSSTRIFVRFPVTQDMQRGRRGNRWERRLRDLQLLEVGVNGGLGSTLSSGRYALQTKQRKRGKSGKLCNFNQR